MSTNPPIQRLRLTYSKEADARYIGHLDVARFWERAFRRVDLPLAYTQGYHPQPRIQFASALPVGIAGEQELLDMLVTRRLNPAEWLPRIARNLPVGFGVSDLREVSMKLPAMQASLRAARYRSCWNAAHGDLIATRVDDLLARPEIIRPHAKKPHKHYDLRPRILDIHIMEAVERGTICLQITLQAGSEGNARVDEVIAALGLDAMPHYTVREELIFDDRQEDNDS